MWWLPSLVSAVLGFDGSTAAQVEQASGDTKTAGIGHQPDAALAFRHGLTLQISLQRGEFLILELPGKVLSQQLRPLFLHASLPALAGGLGGY